MPSHKEHLKCNLTPKNHLVVFWRNHWLHLHIQWREFLLYTLCYKYSERPCSHIYSNNPPVCDRAGGSGGCRCVAASVFPQTSAGSNDICNDSQPSKAPGAVVCVTLLSHRAFWLREQSFDLTLNQFFLLYHGKSEDNFWHQVQTQEVQNSVPSKPQDDQQMYCKHLELLDAIFGDRPQVDLIDFLLCVLRGLRNWSTLKPLESHL